jgi:GxxExxY protein
MTADGLHKELTGQIIGAAYEVHGHLGHGFLEKVYTTALLRELNIRGLDGSSEIPIAVRYKDTEVGHYFADILVKGLVICEIKAVQRLLHEHKAQLLHYLKATGIEVGLLLNFGSTSLQIERLVFSSTRTQTET